MKKERIITLGICIALILGFAIYQSNTQHVREDSKPQDTPQKEFVQVSSPSLAYYETQKQIDHSLRNAIPDEISDYIASVGNGITLNLNKDNKLNVTIRVAILPDAIPLVADNICPIIKSLADKYGVNSYRITFMFYSESNAKGIDTKTAQEWHTEDGINGTFVDASGFYKMSLEDLYEHFNNFGRR